MKIWFKIYLAGVCLMLVLGCGGNDYKEAPEQPPTGSGEDNVESGM